MPKHKILTLPNSANCMTSLAVRKIQYSKQVCKGGSQYEKVLVIDNFWSCRKIDSKTYNKFFVRPHGQWRHVKCGVSANIFANRHILSNQNFWNLMKKLWLIIAKNQSIFTARGPSTTKKGASSHFFPCKDWRWQAKRAAPHLSNYFINFTASAPRQFMQNFFKFAVQSHWNLE